MAGVIGRSVSMLSNHREKKTVVQIPDTGQGRRMVSKDALGESQVSKFGIIG